MIFDGAHKVETEAFTIGEYHMEMSSAGIQCTGHNPFQIDFLRPLNENDYAKLEKTMQSTSLLPCLGPLALESIGEFKLCSTGE